MACRGVNRWASVPCPGAAPHQGQHPVRHRHLGSCRTSSPSPPRLPGRPGDQQHRHRHPDEVADPNLAQLRPPQPGPRGHQEHVRQSLVPGRPPCRTTRARPRRTAGSRFVHRDPWALGFRSPDWPRSAAHEPPSRRTLTRRRGTVAPTTRRVQTGSTRSTHRSPRGPSRRRSGVPRGRRRHPPARVRDVVLRDTASRAHGATPAAARARYADRLKRIDAARQCCPLASDPCGGLTAGVERTAGDPLPTGLHDAAPPSGRRLATLTPRPFEPLQHVLLAVARAGRARLLPRG